MALLPGGCILPVTKTLKRNHNSLISYCHYIPIYDIMKKGNRIEDHIRERKNS